MLLIPCPWCGSRDEVEFRYAGQAHVSAPVDQVGDDTWARYLYFRANPAGRYAERWVHAVGCRQWFNLFRDTLTHEITGVYLPGQRPPEEPA